jgi:hypothetical protein
MPIHENGFVKKLVQHEALVIKKSQFDIEYRIIPERMPLCLTSTSWMNWEKILPVWRTTVGRRG